MTYIADLHIHNDEAAEVEAERILDDAGQRRKKLKGEIEQIIDGEFDRLEDHAGIFLSETATDRAQRFLERVLEGDEDAIASLIGDHHGSRYHEIGYEKGKPWASVIHGTIFETTAMRLRRQIVEANVDLLSNARIKDLESVVDGLQRQIAKLESDLERSRQHYS